MFLFAGGMNARFLTCAGEPEASGKKGNKTASQ
jgi:hypothetical protein